MSDNLRWSPYPQSACVISLDDKTQLGFGTNPIFDSVLGAWNIFWLTFAPLDQLAYYKGELNSYVVNCDALAVCVGAALQTAPKLKNNSTTTFGGLAATVTPKEFIKVVSGVTTFLPFVFYGSKWFDVAKIRAAKYRVFPNNVINADFRKGC